MTKITFLGTGTSQGVPLIGCTCPVCKSDDPKNKRLRSSVWIQSETTSVIIDTGPDFRYQMLRAKVPRVDGIVFTHSHKDHIAGLDDVRAYNYWQKEALNIFASTETQDALKREFQYVFNGNGYPGIPQLNLNTIQKQQPFEIGDLQFNPIQVLHYKMEVFGFRIGDFTYITDANFISEEEMKKLEGTKVLVLNALRHEPHISHFTLQEAIAIATEVGAENTYFTHISHQLGLHDDVNNLLPNGIALAYDRLEVELES